MHLVRLAQGSHWTVYAICNDANTCPLLEFIGELDEKRGAKVLSDLREFVPYSTAQQWVASKFSWQLRNSDTLEFRWLKKKGGTPRVHWFYDDRKIIVCTHGVDKKGDTDPQDIAHAEARKAEYLRDKAAGRLTLTALEDFDCDDEESKRG